MARTPVSKLRRRWWLLALAAVVAVAFVYADHRGWLLVPAGSDFERFHGAEARVHRVIDGDTIDVELIDPRGGTPLTRVRLWGIDAPEMAMQGSPEEPLAAESGEFAESVALGQMVRLHLEPSRVRDRYGRVLAHVEMADGGFLNRAILLEGLAAADERWPHARLTWYEQAERIARQQRRGMWAAE